MPRVKTLATRRVLVAAIAALFGAGCAAPLAGPALEAAGSGSPGYHLMAKGGGGGVVAPPPGMTMVLAGPSVSQFRPAVNRLRIDCPGEVAAGALPTLDSIGATAAANPQTQPMAGHANVFLAGTTKSVTVVGALSFPSLLPPIPAEVGIVLGTATTQPLDTMEIIWPNLDPAAVPGPPIVRIQLGSWTNAVRSGTLLDAVFDVETLSPTGAVVNRWNGKATNLRVP